MSDMTTDSSYCMVFFDGEKATVVFVSNALKLPHRETQKANTAVDALEFARSVISYYGYDVVKTSEYMESDSGFSLRADLIPKYWD